MFRPIAAIISFSSESMVVVLYRIGMGMSRWLDLWFFSSPQNPPAVDIGYGQTIAGDPHRTAASRHT